MILGTDTPSGTGVMPLGLLKTVAELASLGGLDPADALALATGNAGRCSGSPRAGARPARPTGAAQEPLGGTRDDPLAALAAGDLPGIAGVVVDGAVESCAAATPQPRPARPPSPEGAPPDGRGDPETPAPAGHRLREELLVPAGRAGTVRLARGESSSSSTSRASRSPT